METKMFASFIGSPGSGKTTTAALAFAGLKEIGLPVEWIPERARTYIASLRASKKLAPTQPLKLNDNDTLTIMKEQFLVEQTMLESTGNQVALIADGSTLNSLVYLSLEARTQELVQKAALEAAKNYDVVFYCPPVRTPPGFDPNRIHTLEESRGLDQKIQEMLDRLQGKINAPIIALIGTPAARSLTVKNYLLAEGRMR
jgi:thymidylate kinase